MANLASMKGYKRKAATTGTSKKGASKKSKKARGKKKKGEEYEREPNDFVFVKHMAGREGHVLDVPGHMHG